MYAPNVDKSRLRQLLRRARAERGEVEWQADSERVCQRVQQVLLSLHTGSWAAVSARPVRRVALFWPLLSRRELDLRALDAELRAQGKILYYPRMHDPNGVAEWGFGVTASTDDLQPQGGLFEPGAACERAIPGELDVIVAPCLALDDSGYRLGYGAGFYDRVLLRFAPPAVVVGVCYASERLQSLPREGHDRAVDWLVTESEAVPVHSP